MHQRPPIVARLRACGVSTLVEHICRPPPPPITVVCVPLPTLGHRLQLRHQLATMRTRRSGSSQRRAAPAPRGRFDPNAMIGPSGYGPSNFVSGSAQTRFPYQIDFENSPTATAPAQQVTITDTLDPNLDLSTFQLTGSASATPC